ncbi:roundabout homolog 1 isoform X2 [Dunckerocampus dactyliophorus]|uniref:roundabout homolog 1 isoform X2 n=1 Tax=Dunckerocampus dactyliophorus TaxID=161453 RepID=UPI002407069B|nr:roundabout homolog 1 isoform X2 [Dunckerocampus dactyliophorus]
MKVSAWLLCASWLYTWAEYSQRCKCQDLCPTELEDKRSKTRFKVHFGNALGHQHIHVRSRTHHRKGSRVCADDVAPRIVHHPSDVVVKSGKPATFSCRADGNPKPTIEWLHDGQPLEVTKGDGQLQPMFLSDDRLFFLSVGVGRRGQSHEGIYTCVARNSAGTAISHNASLHIATLQEAFTVQPNDVEVAEGEVAVLNCGPPVGHPEPNIIWRKDGLPVNITDFHYTEFNGKLIIDPAEKNHSGAYVCVASNTMGVRESRAARLTVLAKPVLVLKPENVSVRIGESAQFYCQAKGDPPPAVVWSREQGPLPNGRYLVNPDQTLQVHYLTLQDAGKYTCTAVNDVGVVSATAHLLVEASSTKQKDLHKELSALRVTLENVTIMAPGSNMSHVHWELQSLNTQPHYLDGFEVLYRSLLPASSDWVAKKVTVPSFQAQVGPLKRGYKYEFKVRPYGSHLYGRESNTQLLRVPETVPGAAPLAVSITVSHNHNNSIHLNWEPPPSESLNGIIQGYQVWCVESDEQQYQNWTVDRSRHSLDVYSLQPGKRYWITIAAVNGAGVGTLSDPHGFVINPQLGFTSETDSHRLDQSAFVALLQDPILIGSIGALLWCFLMIAAVCLLKRHSRMCIPGRHRAKSLHRLATEDLFINHRITAPDSPWISRGWTPALNQKYQDLWAQGHKHSGIRSASFPVPTNKDPSRLDPAAPVVTDSCSVYGTFYVDLMGNGLKTFNSPRRCPKMPHGLPQQQGAETIQIFTQSAPKTSPLTKRGVLPWKQPIRPQPKMGVLREKSHIKQELHAVSSVPIVTTGDQAGPASVCKQRFSHVPSEYNRGAGCPRLLHYSASLHLLDMWTPPPLLHLEEDPDTHSVTTDEGLKMGRGFSSMTMTQNIRPRSSRSTKMTVDLGSLQSVCGTPGYHAQPGATASNDSRPPYSHLSTSSYVASLDEEKGGTLTAQEATQYLELHPEPEESSALSGQRASRLHPLTTSMSYNAELVPSAQMDCNTSYQVPPIGLHHARLQSSPSSCYSEWDGSLWNTWSSITDGNFASARASLISSVDSCYTNDSSNFTRFVAAESVSGASLSDFSPPASPLSALYPSLRAEGNSIREMEALPAWDWSRNWMEEMEAEYSAARYPGRNANPFHT